MADYQLTSQGVRRTADGTDIPNNTGNVDWVAYTVWVALGNTPDPIYAPTLDETKAQASVGVNRSAATERRQHLDDDSGWIELERWKQAFDADAAGTPVAADYPLLEDEIPTTAATIELVATAVLAERDTVLAAIKAIEGERRTVLSEIAAAVDAAGVATAVAGITWPTPA